MLGSIVLKFNILFFLRIKFFPDDFQPIFEFIIRPFKTPDKREIYQFDHIRFKRLNFITSSNGEKIKKSSEISECFKIMGSQLSFFPYAIRGSMHEIGEFSITSLLQIFTLH